MRKHKLLLLISVIFLASLTAQFNLSLKSPLLIEQKTETELYEAQKPDLEKSVQISPLLSTAEDKVSLNHLSAYGYFCVLQGQKSIKATIELPSKLFNHSPPQLA